MLEKSEEKSPSKMTDVEEIIIIEKRKKHNLEKRGEEKLNAFKDFTSFILFISQARSSLTEC